MRTLLVSLTIAAAALAMSAPAGLAGGMRPGYYARVQLGYGEGWALHDAGCLRWMPQNRSWYNVCRWWAGERTPVVVVTKY